MTAGTTEWDLAGTGHDPLCLFCGEEEHASLFEAWASGEFVIHTCCEGLNEVLAAEMARESKWGRDFLRSLGAEEMLGHELRRVVDDGCAQLLLDYQLRIRPVALREAQAFVQHHHAHCGPPVTARFQAAVWNGFQMLGVALVGNPVARALCGRGIVEVNRLCIRRDVPSALRWNAASMLLGWCAAEAERRGWERIVTYLRQDESAVSVRAAGWHEEARVRGRGWHSARRARSNRNGWVDKVRWGKALCPVPARAPSPVRALGTEDQDTAEAGLTLG